ncbi:hypothetical protein SEND513_98 [Mycobacterium phage Send513]|uniref:Uncharacterized protein n=1 Tax=Mycobacterium phage Send513 TaxID=1034146 RepID=G1BRS6_9CAUD|nr:hypothetical protein FDI62_gp98 [Mycobacterium phage Send513]AEK07542.1 hypothetical protein SEND513_98 [Mycobacterium phage Send513]
MMAGATATGRRRQYGSRAVALNIKGVELDDESQVPSRAPEALED